MYISDWGDSWYIDLMYVCQSTKGKRFHNVLMTPSDKHFFLSSAEPHTHIFERYLSGAHFLVAAIR